MIDVKHTTLVPSLAALLTFRTSGSLDRLTSEAAAERDCVAAALQREPFEISVELAEYARLVDTAELDRATHDPKLRRRLIAIHAIHPDVQPSPSHRTLAAGSVGHGRGVHELLWAGDAVAADHIRAALADTGHHWTSPTSYQWAVAEAAIVPPDTDRDALLERLRAVTAVVDVDHNGRPYPPIS